MGSLLNDGDVAKAGTAAMDAIIETARNPANVFFSFILIPP